MKISVIGCGYLGAVHAAALAHLGHDVIGIDVHAERIVQLSSGSTPFFEPGLEALLREGVESGRLSFSTDMASVAAAEVHFLAVGTPQLVGEDRADLGFVDAAFADLLPHLAPGSLVVGKSTVPVGTADRLSQWLSAEKPKSILAWNPEFLREGFAIEDTLRPDRMVYGVSEGASGLAAERMLDAVYDRVLALNVPKIVSNYATAELVKVSANAFLATKISFINAMAEVCEATGGDVTQLADALGFDARIGRKFLNAGLGFGGGCLPKDIRAFSARAEELGVGPAVQFLHEVDAINTRRRSHVVALAELACGGSVAGKRVAVLGATFKPNSDDVRDSPALDVAVQLFRLGAQVTVTDPQGLENAERKYPELRYERELNSAVDQAEVVVLATEWAEYQSLEPHALRTRVLQTGSPAVIDARNVLDPKIWRDAGWRYFGMGR